MKLKLLCLSFFLISMSGLNAQWSQEQEITLPIEQGEENDPFARSVQSISIENDRVVIGAFRSEIVYIYKRNATGNWHQESKLEASDGTNFDFFGYSVSISGDRILVGAQSSDTKGLNSGAAYVYEQNENGDWLETDKLTASDGRPAHFFGASGAINENIAVVSAIQGPRRGDVYVYEKDINGEWIEKDKLQPSGRSGSDELGGALSISGNSIIIGAKGDTEKGENSGKAYIFNKDENGEWFQEAELSPDDLESGYRFGKSVSISGNKAVVASLGAELEDVAYIYTRNNNGIWQQETKLTPSNISSVSFFNSSSISIRENKIIMAATVDSGELGKLNSAFVYIQDENGIWTQESQLADYAGNNTENGNDSRVGIDGDKAVVVSRYDGLVNFFKRNTATIPIDIQTIITSPSCQDSENGIIQIDVTGGKEPYRYELLDENLNVIIAAQVDSIFENLDHGTYIVKVIDDLLQESLTNEIILVEPEELQLTFSKADISCFGANDGNIEVDISGGSAPYQYRINSDNLTSNNMFTNLSPATYMISVVDSNGCQKTINVIISEPEILAIDTSKSDVTCRGLNDGTFTVNVSGGVAPYQFSLDDANYVTNNNFDDLTPATYDIYVKDAMGYIQTAQVVILEPNSPDFDNDGLGDSCDDDIDGDGIENAIDICSETPLGSTVEADGCLKTPNKDSSVILFPNPIENGGITIALSTPYSGNAQLLLFSNIGTLLTSLTVEVVNGNLVFNLDGWASGIYSIRIETTEESYNQRIIKK
ncbi:T9SS type A sorting domain-containing protein [Maribacter sp.]